MTRGGEIARARVLLAEALHIAENCGAGWHANRARVEWRRAGAPAPNKPDELSPQEAAVAQLAQAGRTNREIAQQLHLSIKTVETHLGHIYQDSASEAVGSTPGGKPARRRMTWWGG